MKFRCNKCGDDDACILDSSKPTSRLPELCPFNREGIPLQAQLRPQWNQIKEESA
jgi:hypothetical protein